MVVEEVLVPVGPEENAIQVKVHPSRPLGVELLEREAPEVREAPVEMA